MTARSIAPAFLATLLLAAPGLAEVRIVAVDGTLARSGRVESVTVRPGQVVSLTADEVDGDGDEARYAYRSVADFEWSADDAPGDACDPDTDCREHSRFEVTDYGVNFYVPWDAPPRIAVTARLKLDGGEDTVVLVVDRPAAGSVEARLHGMGRWVDLGGSPVFVPYAYEDGWEPYLHGYWYWTSYGWTWYGYDPWSPITDHCGHWRHSWLYGWVWVPDRVCSWRPAVVTFFYGTDFIGWYPFDAGWSWGYRHGYADGYDDGFWAGYRVGSGSRHVHAGWVAVGWRDFYVPSAHGHPPARADGGRVYAGLADVSTRRLVDPSAVHGRFLDAVSAGAMGPVPGGGNNPAKGLSFVAKRTGLEPVEVRMKPAWNDASGMAFLAPETPPHEAPARYAEARRAVASAAAGAGPGIRAPVGRAAEAGARSEPSRGVALAPRSRQTGSSVSTWTPRERRGPGGEARQFVPAWREPRRTEPPVRPSYEPPARPVAPRPEPAWRSVERPSVERPSVGRPSIEMPSDAPMPTREAPAYRPAPVIEAPRRIEPPPAAVPSSRPAPPPSWTRSSSSDDDSSRKPSYTAPRLSPPPQPRFVPAPSGRGSGGDESERRRR